MMNETDDPLKDYRPDWKTPKIGAPAADPLADYQPVIQRRAASDATSALPRSRKNASGDFQALTAKGQGRVVADEVLPSMAAHLLSAAQAMPGMERLQAVAGALGSRATSHPMSYSESLETLRGETSKIPADMRHAEQFAAAAPLTNVKALQAMSPAKGGAVLAGSHAALSADSMPTSDRVLRTAGAAAAGGAAGKLIGGIVGGIRTAGAPSLGKAAVESETAMRAGDRVNYGKAADEAAAHYAAGQPTPPRVQTFFQKPEIARYVKMIRRLDRYAQADDATVLQEVYKQLSSEQEGLRAQLAREGYKANKALKMERINELKQEALAGADQIMPSFRSAVGEHAAAEGAQDAASLLTNAGRREVRGGIVPTKKLATESKEAVIEAIRRMPRRDATAARDAVLGTSKESFGVNQNRLTGKLNVNLTAPVFGNRQYLDELDRRIGGHSLDRILTAMGITAVK